MRILFLVEAVFSARDAERFGAKQLAAEGHQVDVVDVTAITQPALVRDRAHYRDFANIALHVANSVDELRRLGSRRDEADLIVSCFGSVGVTPKNHKVYRWLSAAKGTYIKIHCDAYPGMSLFKGEPNRFGERLRNVLRRLVRGQISVARSLIARLPSMMLGVRPPDYVVYGGLACRRTSRFTHPRTREIWAHSFDYETFRKERTAGAGMENIAVFVDEFLPFHPDLATRGQSSPVDPDYYFARMRALFDAVERKLGFRVVIAANPRADYSAHPNAYGQRELRFLETASLIARCRLVLAHRSTAIGLAVMFRKPVCLVALRDTFNHINHRIPTIAYADALRCDVQFIDDDTFEFDASNRLDVDEAAYADFMAQYVKIPTSQDKPLWEIIFSEILGERISSPSSHVGAPAYGPR